MVTASLVAERQRVRQPRHTVSLLQLRRLDRMSIWPPFEQPRLDGPGRRLDLQVGPAVLSELPAPPQVRAAAFRALAALPGVTSLGQVGGGQGVRFTLLGGEQANLIIDPASGQIRATNFFVDNQGATFWQQIPNATITGRWTNTLP